jgi:hypothetical protein
MQTRVEYYRIRATEPVTFVPIPEEIDRLHVDWYLLPPRKLTFHKEIDPNSVRKIHGFIAQGHPFEHFQVEVDILEGLLAKISLVFAMRINTLPNPHRTVVQSVLDQIWNNYFLVQDGDRESFRRLAAIRKQILRFIHPISQHTKYYSLLEVEGRIGIPVETS